MPARSSAILFINAVKKFLAFIFLLYILTFCTSSSTDQKDTRSAKFQQYYLQGELLYINHCSNCHQKEGTGLGRVYPPLNKSDYMDDYFEDVLCLMRYGIQGEISVNGVRYNQRMPGIPSLTDLEIAQITTYIYNSWGHNKGIVEVKEASTILNKCE